MARNETGMEWLYCETIFRFIFPKPLNVLLLDQAAIPLNLMAPR